MIAAVTCQLLLGGSNTLLLNLLRAWPDGVADIRIVSLGEINEHEGDFAALGADVRTGDLRRLIYEDRLRWSYQELAAVAPRAVLAWLGAESFEMLRLAPPGVARIGLVQADDEAVYSMAARYTDVLDAVVGISTAIGEQLRKRPEFRGVRVEQIPNGVFFAPEEPRVVRTPGTPLRVLYLGRLIEDQKRISRVVELARRLESEGAPVRFTIAGAGPDEAAVRMALDGSRIASVVGAIPNREVRGLLREHDVFVLLSDFEGLPVSLLEAMGEGLIPVVSDLASGISEVVTSATGFRVPVGDVAAAQQAILTLAAAPAQLASFSAAASARVRRDFSAERMVAQYRALIDELAAPREASWPASVKIPAPRGLNSWIFSGWRRKLRRAWKGLRSKP